MNVVKGGIKDMRPDTLVQYSIKVETAMTGNTNFTGVVPTVSELTDARKELEAAIQASANRDRVAIAVRRTKEAAVKGLLSRMCNYVNSASAGDLDVALTSGFVAVKPRTPAGVLPPPEHLVARATNRSGEAHLRWYSQSGGRMKQVFMCTGNPEVEASWELVGVTTRNTFLVEHLEPAKFYWFRVNVVGTAGTSGYSDAARCLAA